MKNEKRIKELAECYTVESGKNFKLKHHDPSDTNGLGSEFKSQGQQNLLQQSAQMLAKYQGHALRAGPLGRCS